LTVKRGKESTRGDRVFLRSNDKDDKIKIKSFEWMCR